MMDPSAMKFGGIMVMFFILISVFGSSPDAYSVRVGSFLYYYFDPPVIYNTLKQQGASA